MPDYDPRTPAGPRTDNCSSGPPSVYDDRAIALSSHRDYAIPLREQNCSARKNLEQELGLATAARPIFPDRPIFPKKDNKDDKGE